MGAGETAGTLQFEAPGPGFWELDPVHFPRPVTRYWAEVHPAGFLLGTSDFAEYYGLLIGGLAMDYPNGFGYRAVVPVPDDQVPARFQRGEQVFADKIWREQLAQWDETIKPASIALHRELQAVDVDALSDEELAAYLTRCRDHHAAMLAQHMRHTASAVIPVGDLLAHVGDWTDVSPAELLSLMRGTSPVSAGASEQLEQLIAAIGADPGAQELLAVEGDDAATLEALRTREGGVGAALSAYLELVGNRLLDGFDICEPRAVEMPDLLLRSIRGAVAGGGSGVQDTGLDERIAAVRDSVPEEHREQFDELLGEARLTYRLRDERGVFSDIWAAGIMRRAVLGAGRRLAERGQIHEATDLVDATVDEMLALLAGADAPSADELRARVTYRTTHTAKEAPVTLGEPGPPPPDPSGLPPATARVMRAVLISLGELFGHSDAEHEEDLLRGLAASAGVFEGTARLIGGPADFHLIEEGDVLVTVSTTEAFNILLPLLGAIVTDSGGLLSHSAIVSREYGIPGVVGTREATERIPDGARVRVDGDAGEVTVFA